MSDSVTSNITLVTISDDELSNAYPRKKQWCFTLFYTEEGVDVRLPVELPEGCTYTVFQRESCPDTGRTHLQGFICFTHALRFTTAKARIQRMYHTTNSPRIQYIRGSVDDNVRYCTKSESRLVGTQPIEFGERPRRSGGVQGQNASRGRPTKLARELMLAGKSPIDVLKDESQEEAWSTAFRLARTWKSLLADLVTHRDYVVPSTVILFYGAPGTGKTLSAHLLYPQAYVKITGKWWDHYQGEKSVIYDDFDGSFMQFGDFKTITDRYRMSIEYKGGIMPLSATTHVITSNYWPSHWWSLKVTGRTGREAIWRRISQVWYFTQAGRPASVYETEEFRALPEFWNWDNEDPKARPE